jgi:gamma-glutamylcyclotransferase (GGCT)/AIG2-like uncharacterized protein YtfP
MADRCPSSESVGRADLLDYKMVFRSVADIERVEGGVVFGVLWRILPACERSLDLFETPKYIKRTVTVRHEELGQVEAIVYLMSGRDSQEPPRAVYRDTIAQGYREHDISIKQLNMALREAERKYRKEIGSIRKAELDY